MNLRDSNVGSVSKKGSITSGQPADVTPSITNSCVRLYMVHLLLLLIRVYSLGKGLGYGQDQGLLNSSIVQV